MGRPSPPSTRRALCRRASAVTRYAPALEPLRRPRGEIELQPPSASRAAGVAHTVARPTSRCRLVQLRFGDARPSWARSAIGARAAPARRPSPPRHPRPHGHHTWRCAACGLGAIAMRPASPSVELAAQRRRCAAAPGLGPFAAACRRGPLGGALAADAVALQDLPARRAVPTVHHVKRIGSQLVFARGSTITRSCSTVSCHGHARGRVDRARRHDLELRSASVAADPDATKPLAPDVERPAYAGLS